MRAPGQRFGRNMIMKRMLKQDVKTNALGKSRLTNKAEMIASVRSHPHRRQKQPHVIRNLFREKHVRFAA